MGTAISEPRYELKMVFGATQLPEVRSWTHLHSAGFRVTYPPRQVNNVYFDTSDLDAFNDHLDGITARRKLRYRWYGGHFAPQRGTLEVKYKSARIGRKMTQPVICPLDFATMSWAAVRRALIASADDVFAELLRTAAQALINHYRREYYVSSDGLTRVTLDYDLRAYSQHAAVPNITFPNPPDQVMLIEFKRGLGHEADFADILAEFPQRVTRYSKYVDALDAGW